MDRFRRAFLRSLLRRARNIALFRTLDAGPRNFLRRLTFDATLRGAVVTRINFDGVISFESAR